MTRLCPCTILKVNYNDNRDRNEKLYLTYVPSVTILSYEFLAGFLAIKHLF